MGSEYRSIKRPKFSYRGRKTMEYIHRVQNDFTSKLKWWGGAKAMVKTIAMIFSIHKKHIVKELDCVNIRLLRKSEGHRIRARIPNFEEQEPSIAYYSRMEKIRSEGRKHDIFHKR